MWVGLRHNALHFSDGDHRQEAAEQQEQHTKEAERPQHGADVNPGRNESIPTRRQEVIGETGDDDHEALKPHAHVDEEAEDEHQRNAGANLLEPEELRSDDVATHHDPIRPRVLTEGAVHECKLFVQRAGVPGDEEFHPVRIANHASGHQDDLVHVVQVAERDQVLQSEQLTRRHRQGHHHGKATEDGAGNKVRREDGGVPARKLTGGKVKGHHAVHRKHQRSGERCQQQVRALITVPMAIGAAPSEREQTVRHLLNLALGTIAHGGQVRHQTDVPEEQRNREIGAHCKDVP